MITAASLPSPSWFHNAESFPSSVALQGVGATQQSSGGRIVVAGSSAPTSATTDGDDGGDFAVARYIK